MDSNELTTDECLAILDERINIYENSKAESMKSFEENFEFDHIKCYIRCKSTGKQFKYSTGIGMQKAFTKMGKYARNELNIKMNQYIVYDEIISKIF